MRTFREACSSSQILSPTISFKFNYHLLRSFEITLTTKRVERGGQAVQKGEDHFFLSFRVVCAFFFSFQFVLSWLCRVVVYGLLARRATTSLIVSSKELEVLTKVFLRIGWEIPF